jgi:NAD-dependent SIR2 family protein deacetylase
MRAKPANQVPTDFAARLQRHRPLFVLTGAGVSTASGIPDYRDTEGHWKHRRPVQYADFVRSPSARQRYWARSMLGWPRISDSQPNAAHLALSRLQQAGFISRLVTQNVDGLHQKAGSREVIDLHGRLDTVICLGCGDRQARTLMQARLQTANPSYMHLASTAAPDGDADLQPAELDPFQVPDCEHCKGLLKPDVVFFGENVPRARVEQSLTALARSHGVLVVGSSLMVYSGYRFCVAAHAQGKPVFSVSLGRTRADGELAASLNMDCGEALTGIADRICD